jgi:hypothetical protein
MWQFLGDGTNDLDAGGLRQTRELFERVLYLPGRSMSVDGEQQRLLGRFVGRN